MNAQLNAEHQLKSASNELVRRGDSLPVKEAQEVYRLNHDLNKLIEKLKRLRAINDA